MQLTLELPEKVVRKMRALAVLKENDSQDFLEMIASYIDRAVSEEIIEAVGGSTMRAPALVRGASPSSHPLDFVVSSDSGHDIADGLSNEAAEDEEAPKSLPRASSVSPQDLERDNLIEDPEHEAVSPDNMEMTFEEAFAGATGPREPEASLSDPEENPFRPLPANPAGKVPRSIPPKKLPKGVKAKVSAFEGGEESVF